MKADPWVVMLEHHATGTCWLASGEGDPARTMKLENAKQFKRRSYAIAALTKARSYRPFRRAVVMQMSEFSERD